MYSFLAENLTRTKDHRRDAPKFPKWRPSGDRMSIFITVAMVLPAGVVLGLNKEQKFKETTKGKWKDVRSRFSLLLFSVYFEIDILGYSYVKKNETLYTTFRQDMVSERIIKYAK